MAGWTIMATPAIYYITSNCCLGLGLKMKISLWKEGNLTRQVPFFVQYVGLVVAMISGIFDMSPGLFLLFKLGFQQYNADLVVMLRILTSLSLIIWIRTFFLMPGKIIDKKIWILQSFLVYRSDPSKTLYEQSFFGQLYHNKKGKVRHYSKSIPLAMWGTLKVVYSDQKNATKIAFKQLVPAIKSINVWQFSIFYTGRLKTSNLEKGTALSAYF